MLQMSRFSLLHKSLDQMLSETEPHAAIHFGPRIQIFAQLVPIPHHYFRLAFCNDRTVRLGSVVPGKGNIVDEGTLIDVGKIVISDVQLGMTALHKVNFLAMLTLDRKLCAIRHGLGGTQRQELLELTSGQHGKVLVVQFLLFLRQGSTPLIGNEKASCASVDSDEKRTPLERDAERTGMQEMEGHQS